MEAHARLSMVLGKPMQDFVHVRQASTQPTELQPQHRNLYLITQDLRKMGRETLRKGHMPSSLCPDQALPTASLETNVPFRQNPLDKLHVLSVVLWKPVTTYELTQ